MQNTTVDVIQAGYHELVHFWKNDTRSNWLGVSIAVDFNCDRI